MEAADWEPTKNCGHGLHGFINGEGSGDLASWDSDAVWIAAWVDSAKIIDLNGKVKFPWADVALAGTRQEATQFLIDNGCKGSIVGSTLIGGDKSTLTGGDGSTLTGGDKSTLTGGDGSTLTGRDRSTLTGGDGSTLIGGYGSTLTGGYGSTLIGGYGSTLTGGDKSTITFSYWDGRRYKTASFEVGDDGLKPGKAYKCDESGKVSEVSK